MGALYEIARGIITLPGETEVAEGYARLTRESEETLAGIGREVLGDMRPRKVKVLLPPDRIALRTWQSLIAEVPIRDARGIPLRVPTDERPRQDGWYARAKGYAAEAFESLLGTIRKDDEAFVDEGEAFIYILPPAVMDAFHLALTGRLGQEPTDTIDDAVMPLPVQPGEYFLAHIMASESRRARRIYLHGVGVEQMLRRPTLQRMAETFRAA